MPFYVDKVLRRARRHVLAGEIEEAENNFEQILSRFPKNKKAIQGYRQLKAIKIAKGFSTSISPEKILSELNTLYDQGQFEQVLSKVNLLIDLFPNLATLLKIQGEANKALQRYEAAIESYKKVIDSEPHNLTGYTHLGLILQKIGNFDEAIENYEQAINIDPYSLETYNNLGNALQEIGNFNAAIDNYEKAIKIKPDSAECFTNMGNALKAKGDLDAAIYSYKKAIKFDPDYASAYYSMGAILNENADFVSALNYCDKAIRIQSDYRAAKYLKARLLLNCHEFELGWSLYHASRDPAAEDTLVVTKRAEMWKGSSLRGKNIQVYAAQGVGDEIGFSSCIPDLIELSPKTIYLECDPRLKPLFERSFPEIITYGKARTQWLAEHFTDSDIPNIDDHIDYSISIDGLPQFFRNQLEDFPKRNSFLLPDPKLVKKWSKRLKAIGDGLKVGISWKGGTGKAKIPQSIPLRFWQDLLSADAFFINLQYGETSDEVSKFSAENGIKIYDWEDNDASIDLDNQAALISELDLVISVDNATVHSCMALGTEIWDLMDPGRNLMWMDNGKNVSPLSPHLRLFKKKPLENWDKVFTQVEIELRARIAKQ